MGEDDNGHGNKILLRGAGEEGQTHTDGLGMRLGGGLRRKSITYRAHVETEQVPG